MFHEHFDCYKEIVNQPLNQEASSILETIWNPEGKVFRTLSGFYLIYYFQQNNPLNEGH